MVVESGSDSSGDCRSQYVAGRQMFLKSANSSGIGRPVGCCGKTSEDNGFRNWR